MLANNCSGAAQFGCKKFVSFRIGKFCAKTSARKFAEANPKLCMHQCETKSHLKTHEKFKPQHEFMNETVMNVQSKRHQEET